MKLKFQLFLLFSCLFFIHCSNKDSKEGYKNGMVVSANSLASQIGIDILKNGGNAFDAAIGVQFALSVVYPSAGNIGGGGFVVYRLNDGSLLL